MTAGIYLFNGAAFAITGPAVYIGHDTLKEMKYQGAIFWRSIMIPLIFVSTVIWDTLSFLTAPRNKEKEQSLVPRQLVRKCNQRIKRILPNLQSLYFFPAWWLIFENSVSMSSATYQAFAPLHPIAIASANIADTHRRIKHLDTLVDLSPGTFSQYQKLQAKKWLLETFPKERKTTSCNEVHCDNDYFDTYEEFPVETGEHFFDSEGEIDVEPCANLCDVLNLDSIYQGRRVVDCTGTDSTCNSTQQDHTEVNLSTSDRALCVLLDGAVITPVAFTTADLLAHIIFDTGASLAISPYRSDVIDDPTLLAKPTQLGGMGKGLHIEGVGTVAWTFMAKYKSEIQLRVKAYYVPAAKARLLSPQKLFNKKSGVFGHFYGDEDKFTLQVGN
jgi:hypothetical protein